MSFPLFEIASSYNWNPRQIISSEASHYFFLAQGKSEKYFSARNPASEKRSIVYPSLCLEVPF